MFEKSFQRPSNFFKLSAERQWEIDKELGILDWVGKLTKEEKERFENHYKTKTTMSKANTLINDCFWNKDKTVWRQPPVPIKLGNLVDIEYNNLTVLGRYIGKGKGAAITFTPNRAIFVGYVVGRGIDRNPKLPTVEELFELFEE